MSEADYERLKILEQRFQKRKEYHRNYMVEYQRRKKGCVPRTSMFPGLTGKEYQKAYKEHHKEKINERANQIMQCDVCGASFTVSHRSRHVKTAKHLGFLDQAKA